MNKKELIKHKKIIKEWVNNPNLTIEMKVNGISEWSEVISPQFDINIEYRIKRFTPKNGDIILVSSNNIDFYKRLFVKIDNNKYYCIISDIENIISLYDDNLVHLTCWKYAKAIETTK